MFIVIYYCSFPAFAINRFANIKFNVRIYYNNMVIIMARAFTVIKYLAAVLLLRIS